MQNSNFRELLHCVCHPVDDIDHSEGEREDSASVDVDGVGVDGFALAAFLLFSAFLLSPTGLRSTNLGLFVRFSRRVSGPLGPALPVRDQETLVHASHRQRKENHCLLSIFHHGLQQKMMGKVIICVHKKS